MLTRFAGFTAIFLLATASPSSTTGAAAATCCRIVGINARGIAMVRNNSSGKTFLISLRNRSLLNGFRLGSAVDFSRSRGLVVSGMPAGAAIIIRPPKGGGTAGITMDIDCSITPEACPGSKPIGKITMDGATTWDDVIDYCYDDVSACTDGGF
jgi:hypothetical protein